MRRLRFDAIELAGLVAFAVVATVTLMPARPNRVSVAPLMAEGELLNQLEARFGREKYSHGPEEWLIRDFFNDRRDGVFVDVGAFHPVNMSNTYRLERDFGWRGMAIDALAEFSSGYAKSRPRSKFVLAFVGDVDQGEATLHVDPDQAVVASSDQAFTAKFTSKAVPRQVPRRTLDSILAEAGIEKVDFVSMDIELGEPDALKAFDLARHRPDLLCIEAHVKTRQAIIDALAAAGYVIVGRYLRVDETNLYFTPKRDRG
jgi:FkbM family methyltransferase